MTGLLPRMFSTPIFWILLIVVPFLALIPDLTIKFLRFFLSRWYRFDFNQHVVASEIEKLDKIKEKAIMGNVPNFDKHASKEPLIIVSR